MVFRVFGCSVVLYFTLKILNTLRLMVFISKDDTSCLTLSTFVLFSFISSQQLFASA